MSESRRTGNLGNAQAYRRATGWTKGTCTWCRVELPSRRMTWCRDQDPATGFNPCLAEFFARQHYPSARPYVWIRDRGHCRDCGRDLRYQDQQNPRFSRVWREMSPEAWEAHRLKIGGGAEPWECDHIVPVAKGGGALGLDNLQVLCVPCHKRKTAEQAAEAAAERRALLPPEPTPCLEQLSLFGPQASDGAHLNTHAVRLEAANLCPDPGPARPSSGSLSLLEASPASDTPPPCPSGDPHV